MTSPNSNDQPLKELKHEAVPGYRLAFTIAFAVMSLYLLIILVSSPGPAGGHGHHDDSHQTEPAHGSEEKSGSH